MKSFYIIDAMAMIYRNFFGFSHTRLTTSKGLPTNAIFGTARFMNKLMLEERPDYLLIVWDSALPTFRHKAFPAYKASRDFTPQDLDAQMPYIDRLFKCLNVQELRMPGFEADDLIASFCAKIAKVNDVKGYIVSGDKDFLQLVSDRVCLYTPRKGAPPDLIDRKAVIKRFGCTPEQMVDCLALMGDAVDDVPGVTGIGEKTAAKLIAEYGSIDNLYAHLDSLKSQRQRDNLHAEKKEAYLSRDLVRLRHDIPLPLTIDACAVDPLKTMERPALLGFYEELEFQYLLDHITESFDNQKAPPVTRVAHVPPASYHRIELSGPNRNCDSILERANTVRYFAFDLKSDLIDIHTAKPTSLSIAFSDGDVFFIPIAVPAQETQAFCQQVLNSRATKITHNLKFRLQMLESWGVPHAGPFVDTMLCDYLLEPTYVQHGFESCIFRHLKIKKNSYLEGESAGLIMRLYELLWPQIEAQQLVRVLQEVEMPLVPVLARMEKEGLFIDTERMRLTSESFAKKIETISAEIFAIAGRSFNINSTKQLQSLLFEELDIPKKLGIKKIKKTKTGYSTDESVLESLDAHPLPRLVLTYRHLTKLLNTYVDALPQLIHPQTHRVHTHLAQTVTATGRLSSSQPNLQNIPAHGNDGHEIRTAFRPQIAGHVLISADYSQIEIRLLCHLAGSKSLRDAFRNNLDIHAITASKIFGVAVSQVTSAQRQQAKAINFGLIYGMGPQRLARQTNVTLAEAKAFMARYFEVYPEIKAYTQGLIDSARKLGYSTTLLGRRRPIPELAERNLAMRARAENIAVNAPIQGSAADLIKLAMIRIVAKLNAGQYQTRMILQVHDELLFEGPAAEADAVCALVKDGMENVLPMDVPLSVQIKIGTSWADIH